MNSNFKVTGNIAVAIALIAGGLGIAHAGDYSDNSMSRFGGDGYAYFSQDKPSFRKGTSTFRQTDPKGLSIPEYQTLSSEGPQWQTAPVFDGAPPAFPRGSYARLSVDDYQALSSNSSKWQPQTAAYDPSMALEKPPGAAFTAAK
jgi:hypothetical protein